MNETEWTTAELMESVSALRGHVAAARDTRNPIVKMDLAEKAIGAAVHILDGIVDNLSAVVGRVDELEHDMHGDGPACADCGGCTNDQEGSGNG